MKPYLNKKVFKGLIIITLLLLCVSVTAQNLNSDIKAEVSVNDSPNEMMEILASAQNLTEGNYSLRYELSVISSDSNNNSSKNSQSGRFTLEPFETKKLSQTTISINPDKRTIILLLIYNEDDKLLGTDRKVFDSSQKEEKEKQKNMSYKKDNEGIQLTGMVTENTKTKPGKDFYDFFYQKYNLSPYKGNKIIQIDEMISYGRTTRIMVKVDDVVIFQFFARPKLDYLKEKADEAVKQVSRYFEYLKNRNESNLQY